MRERPVVRVGAVAGKVKRPAVTARGLADVLDVEAAPLERAIRGGGKEQFVDALTLRPTTTAACVPRWRPSPTPRPPSRPRARPEPRVRARAARDRRAGHQGAAREARRQRGAGSRRSGSGACRRASSGGSRRSGAAGRDPAGRPPDRDAGQAPRAPRPRARHHPRQPGPGRGRGGAGRAVDEAALVAVQPSTGDILAVANRPVESSYDRALEGTTRPAPPSRWCRPRRCCATGSPSARP